MRNCWLALVAVATLVAVGVPIALLTLRGVDVHDQAAVTPEPVLQPAAAA